MKISGKIIILSLLIALIPLAIYGIFYPQLPDQIATHFDFAGNANGYTSREGLWVPLITPLWLIPLLVIVPRIDPRGKSYDKLGNFYPAFVLGMTIFLSGLMSVMVLNALPNIELPIEKITPISIGLLFVVLGNYMPKMKQSYTLGIKTPWTLHSEVVWNKTHRIAGPCFMIAGLVMLLSMLLPTEWMLGAVLGCVLIAAGIPSVMSYVYYKQEQQAQ